MSIVEYPTQMDITEFLIFFKDKLLFNTKFRKKKYNKKKKNLSVTSVCFSQNVSIYFMYLFIPIHQRTFLVVAVVYILLLGLVVVHRFDIVIHIQYLMIELLKKKCILKQWNSTRNLPIPLS